MFVLVLVRSVSLDDASEELKEAIGSSVEPDVIVTVERVRVDQSSDLILTLIFALLLVSLSHPLECQHSPDHPRFVGWLHDIRPSPATILVRCGGFDSILARA